MLAFANLPGIYKYLDMCMVACAGYYLSLASSVQIFQGLRAQSSHHCAECESAVCTTKSSDGPNPYFAHNVVTVLHGHRN